MKCWISFNFASCGCIACCCKLLLIQVHGVHENGRNNSFIVSDFLAFLRARKQCFDLGVQELTNIPRNDWRKEGLLRLVDVSLSTSIPNSRLVGSESCLVLVATVKQRSNAEAIRIRSPH